MLRVRDLARIVQFPTKPATKITVFMRQTLPASHGAVGFDASENSLIR